MNLNETDIEPIWTLFTIRRAVGKQEYTMYIDNDVDGVESSAAGIFDIRYIHDSVHGLLL